jgi:parallel beta-helix repeat protein
MSENNITNNGYGIYLYLSCSNNSMSGNNITDNSYGIWVATSSNYNSMSGNNIAENGYGIYLYASSRNNSISGNNITTNNGSGIDVNSSYNNSVSGNDVTYNHVGMSLESSWNNTIYHNNFKNNNHQVYGITSENFWDNGYPSGGNYWSDYNGTDSHSGAYQNQTGSDGIGDKPYVIDANNTDRYPLMSPINSFDVGTWNAVAYSVDTVSNSSIANLSFNPAAKTLSFNVSGANGTKGFCRVSIPLPLMFCANPEDWTVTVNGMLIEDRAVFSDANYTYIYFTYNHSTEAVQIQSTNAIPEIQSSLLLSLLMTTTLLAISTHKKKRGVKDYRQKRRY